MGLPSSRSCSCPRTFRMWHITTRGMAFMLSTPKPSVNPTTNLAGWLVPAPAPYMTRPRSREQVWVGHFWIVGAPSHVPWLVTDTALQRSRRMLPVSCWQFPGRAVAEVTVGETHSNSPSRRCAFTLSRRSEFCCGGGGLMAAAAGAVLEAS